MVLSRGRPPFLTQIEWDLIRSSTSQIKVKEVSRFGYYMYSEYRRVVQIKKERVWISVQKFIQSIQDDFQFCLLIYPFGLDFFCFPGVFSFSLILEFLFYFVMIVTPVHFIFGCSFQFCAMKIVFDCSFEILPSSANCKFNALIFICFFNFLTWISPL